VPCRTIESNPTSYRASWEDRSPFLKVSKDGLSLLGDKGFRTARCNAPIREGKWYIEIRVIRGGGEFPPEAAGKQDGSHVRLGWCRREASINGPVGLDGYSYGIRDKTGEKVTLSRPTSYGRSFGSGDVIGMYISLPPKRQADPTDPTDPARLHRQRIAIEFKGQEYFESLEYPVVKEMSSLMSHAAPSSTALSLPSNSSKKSATVKNVPERPRAKVVTEEAPSQTRALPVLPGSRIAFFVNGESQGIAFQDIYDYLQLRKEPVQKAKEKKKRDGAREHRENPFDDGYLGYYPSISLFNHASVHINPGPNFDFPPPQDVDALLDNTPPSEFQTWRPICERYAEFMDEQWALDQLEEEEARLELAKREQQQQQSAPKKATRARKRQNNQEPKKRATKKSGIAAVFDRRTPGTEEQKFSQLGSVQPSPLRFGYTASTEDIQTSAVAAESPASMVIDHPPTTHASLDPMEWTSSGTNVILDATNLITSSTKISTTTTTLTDQHAVTISELSGSGMPKNESSELAD
jgi:COMPASS component BRE2